MDSGASTVVDRAPEHAASRSRGAMYALLLLATFCWAANIVAGKIVMRGGIGPVSLAQLRVAGGAAGFLIIRMARRRPWSRPTRRDWFELALAAIFGITLNQLLFISGIGSTSAAHSGLIVALGPVMVLVLACALRLESFTALKAVGGIVALAGVAVLATGKGHNGVTVRGDLLVLAGSAVFAYYTVLLKKLVKRFDALSLNLLTFGIGLVCMPFAETDLWRIHWSALGARTWWCLGFIIIPGTVVAYLIYVDALRALTATRVAAFNYLQPVIAAGLGVWLLAERLTIGVLAGGALILAGVYLTEWERGSAG